jgi:uncharacterized membrane protein YbhN (UPF0104 family)
MSPTGKRVWIAVKSVVALAIVSGVGAQFWRILASPELAGQTFPLRVPFACAAGLLYLTAHTVWALFWWRLLLSQGVAISWRAAVRAYFVSQFGKYVPGKVWVLLLRVGLLRGTGASRAVVAVTALYETLTNMAAGAMLAAALVLVTGVGGEYVSGNLPGLIGIAILPGGVWVFLKLAGRVAGRARGPDARPLPNPSAGLLLSGLLQASTGWCLLGISLAAAVRAVHPDPPPLTGAEFVRDLAAVSAAYVFGFIILVSPGGLGPREFLLKEFLTVDFADRLARPEAEGTAVVTALVLRLVWTAFEVVLAGGWYLLGRTGPHSSEPEAMKERAVNHAD